MDTIRNLFYSIVALVDKNNLYTLLKLNSFTYIIVIALFCCVILLVNTFSRYKVLSLRILVAWIVACLITLFYLVGANNVELETQRQNINSQIILSYVSSILLIIFYIFSFFGSKSKKKKKNFGRNTWWINIISFIVLLAFCCIFNIGLFIASALFYL